VQSKLVLFEIQWLKNWRQTFGICGKNFKNFGFTNCKIIGLEVERKCFFFVNCPPIAKKV